MNERSRRRWWLSKCKENLRGCVGLEGIYLAGAELMVSQLGQVQKRRRTLGEQINEPRYTQTMHIHNDTDGLLVPSH